MRTVTWPEASGECLIKVYFLYPLPNQWLQSSSIYTLDKGPHWILTAGQAEPRILFYFIYFDFCILDFHSSSSRFSNLACDRFRESF